MTDTLLSVKNLTLNIPTGSGTLHAVRGIDFDLKRGETLSIVGESGSGKSLTSLAVMGLLGKSIKRQADEMRFDNVDLQTANRRVMRDLRGNRIAMIFQEPMTSLNPLLTVGRQLTETLEVHTDLTRAGRRARAIEMLDHVGIPAAASRLEDYPHQFSGGMRQRVMIAIALAAEPQLLLADEPTTALDVTIQAQILDLILRLSDEMNMAVILVTHDLGVVAQTCESVAVMYAGRIVEQGSVREVLSAPRHRYTTGLMQSVPQDVPPRTPLFSVPGAPPSLLNLPQGCAYAARCDAVRDRCIGTRPPLEEIAPGRRVACYHPEPLCQRCSA